MRDEIISIRKRIEEYVSNKVPDKNGQDYRMTLAIFSRLNDLDDELMKLETMSVPDEEDSFWFEDYANLKLKKVREELESMKVL